MRPTEKVPISRQKLALSLQRCRKTQKLFSHAVREAVFFVTLAERGKTIFEICDTSAVKVRTQKQPCDCRGVAKNTIEKKQRTLRQASEKL